MEKIHCKPILNIIDKHEGLRAYMFSFITHDGRCSTVWKAEPLDLVFMKQVADINVIESLKIKTNLATEPVAGTILEGKEVPKDVANES